MRTQPAARVTAFATAVALATLGLRTPPADSACCYFSAKDNDVLQPAQESFLTLDPVEKVGTVGGAPMVAARASKTRIRAHDAPGHS